MNMKKTTVAAAVSLGMGVTGTADALNVQIHTLNFNGISPATGSLFDTIQGTSSLGDPSYGTYQSTPSTPFFGHAYQAAATAYFDTHGPVTWSGTYGTQQWTVQTTLTDNQIAWGSLFNWNNNIGIPVFNVFDCPNAPTSTCTSIAGTPMPAGPFAGQEPLFGGDIHSGSVPFSGGGEVPIPAAAWLFGSGLVGLAGISRRRKKK